jgi:hypothetical protein
MALPARPGAYSDITHAGVSPHRIALRRRRTPRGAAGALGRRHRQAATDLTAAARDVALSIPIGTPLPLERAAEAHDRVDAGGHARTLLAIPTDRATLIQSMLAAGLVDDLPLAVDAVLLSASQRPAAAIVGRGLGGRGSAGKHLLHRLSGDA